MGNWFLSASQTSLARPGASLDDVIYPSETPHSLLSLAAWLVVVDACMMFLFSILSRYAKGKCFGPVRNKSAYAFSCESSHTVKPTPSIMI